MVWAFIYIITLHKRVAKAHASPRICADSPEPLLLASAMSTESHALAQMYCSFFSLQLLGTDLIVFVSEDGQVALRETGACDTKL